MALGSSFGQELSFASLVKLVSFLFWSGLYLQSAVAWPQRSPEWCSRLVTLLHGSVAALVGLMQCDVTNLSPCTLTMKVTACHYALMVWSWGYFAFDLLWCLVYWSESVLMLCHHSSALAAITIYMQKDYTGCTFACTLALMEITNPLLQTRWLLFDLDEKLISIMFYIVSMAFVYQIVGYVLYKYKTKIGALRDFLDDMGIMSEHR
ncbi:Uncharacterized protein OBRU01_16518 [Operophtera brumata]|uniref:TLC domain-containing protein n=1 Tax=Operophtera brumata TaxID=104452 RepID=A0A0L7KTP8_OPEBR|nr:Uncharacterized protein OBRU01_16518 [Operophtera brumata]